MFKLILRLIVSVGSACVLLTFAMWLGGRMLRVEALEIAYLRGNANQDIYLLDVERRLPLRLFEGGPIRDLAWSPDGHELVFSMQARDGHNLYRLNAFSGATEILSAGSYYYNAIWSPDGRRIAHLQIEGGAQIIIHDIAMQAVHIVPDVGLIIVRIQNWVDDQTLLVTGLEFNRVMAFLIDIKTGIYRLPTTTDTFLLAIGVRSPDAHSVLYVTNTDLNQELYVARPDGTSRQRLTFSAGADIAPSWSVDGRYIAFTSTRDGSQEIYMMDAIGEQQQRLTFSPQTTMNWLPAWRP